MKVLLANPRGFCAGVNMAIEALEKALELFDPPVYVYHEIVHNRHVVEKFRDRGVRFVNSIEDVPVGALLMYSAHGVSPEIRQSALQRKLRTFDATCPLVTKVHLEAIRFAQEGYRLILIGHEGHDEVLGTMGEVPGKIQLIQEVEDIDRLESLPTDRIAYLTQTTLSVDDASRIITALKHRFPHVVGPKKEDICYATQNRQEAVRTLAPEADLVLVIGSQNSSNSQRLVEIAKSCGKDAYLIDGPSDIQSHWFQPTDTILITAGASAPENVVRACIQFFEREHASSVEERTIRQESVHFAMPKELSALH